MNITKYLHRISILALLVSSHTDLCITLYGKSFLAPRSQSTNAARDCIVWLREIYQPEAEDFYGAFATTAEYTQTFRPFRLAEYFFSTDTLAITGSQVPDRSENEFLADYFGLSQYFDSDVLLKPILQNALADIAFFGGYHDWYFYVHAPVTWTSSQIKMYEAVHNNGVAIPYAAGYMATDEVTAPYASFSQAMTGTRSFGEVAALKFGKIPCQKLTHVALSDIQANLGYILVNNDYGFAGFHLRAGFPTGNRPNSEFLLEPIVGSGKHGELGLGFLGNVLIWECNGDQEVYFCVDINGTHLFSTRQQRSFDFCRNGFGSRYMLIKQFDSSGIYTGTTVPAINITTLTCNVDIAFQLDAVFMFNYAYKNFGFDLGYNAWLKSHENISNVRDPFALPRWGIKGIQNIRLIDGEPDQATQSTATLDGNDFDDQALVADPDSPVFIKPDSLNLCSAAAPLAFTHKIFWCFSYHWECTAKRAIPLLGIGGEVEFEGERPKDQVANKNAVAQWGIWVKGGFGW